MAKLYLVAVTALALTGAACASTKGPTRYQQELDQLDKECRERGGVLTTTGVSTGRPQTEYMCRLTNASRITGR